MNWKRMCDVILSATIAGFLYTFCVPAVNAQNPQCPTRPAGDNTNACASTQFVQNAISNPIPPLTIGEFTIGAGSQNDKILDWGQQVLYLPNLTTDPSVFGSSFYGNGGQQLVRFTNTVTIAPLGGAGTAAVISWTGHGLLPTNTVGFRISGGTLPAGISANTEYCILTAGFGANSFRITATLGAGCDVGAAVTISAASTPTIYAGDFRDTRYNLGVSQQALYNITSGAYNTGGGFETLYSLTTGWANTAWGEAACFSVATTYGNTCIGWKSGLTSTGAYNNWNGYGSGLNNTTGDYNDASGAYSMYGAGGATMDSNTAHGAYALQAGSSAARNSVLGREGLYAATTTTDGVFIGYRSGKDCTIGCSNATYIGANTGSGVITGTGSTLIGANQTGLSAGLTNEIRLSDGLGALGFRSDSSRNTYLGDSSTGKNVYLYYGSASNNAGFTTDSSGNLGIFTGTAAPLNRIFVYATGGINIGTPTGGDKGAGSLNMVSCYVNDVACLTTGSTLNLVVGTTTISSGTTTRILYDNAGVLGEYTLTGTGTVVAMQTAPTFVTSITVPLVIGGSGTTGTQLTLKTTTGNGTTDAFAFVGGNNGATTFGSWATAGLSVTSAGASAFSVGPNGSTNPVLRIDGSTASAATGITITGAAAAGRVQLTARSSGTDEGLSIDAKGAGTIRLGATSTGAVEFSRNAVPTASDGAALGTTSLMWSDLFLASGGVINFNAGNVTITHSAGVLTTNAGTFSNTLSQNNNTQMQVVNSNAGASASASFIVGSNQGNFTFQIYSTAAGGGTFQTPPSGSSMTIDMIGASDNFIVRTNSFNEKFRVTTSTSATSSTVGSVQVTGGLAVSGAGWFGTYMATGVVAVGSLPACGAGIKGARMFVNDSNAVSYTAGIGAVVAAGGATNVPVICDGTNWRIGQADIFDLPKFASNDNTLAFMENAA